MDTPFVDATKPICKCSQEAIKLDYPEYKLGQTCPVCISMKPGWKAVIGAHPSETMSRLAVSLSSSSSSSSSSVSDNDNKHTTKLLAVRDATRWPVEAEQPPVFNVRLANEAAGVFSDCELLIDQGNMRCDLYLAAHDAIKLGLFPSTITKVARPVSSPTIVIRCMGTVTASVRFPATETQPETEKKALLEVYVNDEEYNEVKGKKSISSSSSPSSSCDNNRSQSVDSSKFDVDPLPSIAPPIIRLSPIRYRGGTSKGSALIGKSGMRKLRLRYSAESNTIDSLDLPEIMDI